MKLSIIRMTPVFGNLYINGRYECFVFEHPEKKIDPGIYDIGLRKVGGLHYRYAKKFGALHRGMVLIKNVPGRKYIQFHIGNRKKDTAGCPLPGTMIGEINGEQAVLNSTDAYLGFYIKVARAIENCEIVDLQIFEEV